MSQPSLPGFESTDDRGSQRETTKPRSAIPSAVAIHKIGNPVLQLGLPSMAEDRLPRCSRRRYTNKERPERHPLISLFKDRVARRNSARTATQYCWVMEDLVRLACWTSRGQQTVIELFRVPGLLGTALATAMTGNGSRQVSAWLAAQRRSVARACADLLAAELAAEGIKDPVGFVADELRKVAEPVGSGFRLPVGSQRGRGGPMSSRDEATAILSALSSELGWVGLRNQLILSLLLRRGQRIGGLLGVDGTDLHRLPNGSFRLVVRTKSTRQRFELEIPTDLHVVLQEYVKGFNSWARATGVSTRIGEGVPGPFWRTLNASQLTYDRWTKELKIACGRAGTATYTSHALRRAFASMATEFVSRSLTSLVGNWQNPRLMDEHYIQPSISRVRSQLSKLSLAQDGRNRATVGEPKPLPLSMVAT